MNVVSAIRLNLFSSKLAFYLCQGDKITKSKSNNEFIQRLITLFIFSTGGNKDLVNDDEKPRYGESLSVQESSNKRKEKGAKSKSDDKFGEIDDWESEFGYINPLVDCRLV